MADTFLNHINVNKVDQLLKDTDVNVTYFNNACMKVVSAYSGALDSLMSEIYVTCVKNTDTSMDVLENYYLELTNMVYFMNDKVEQLGIYADMSADATKETYSKSYLASSEMKDANGKSKSTVAELQAKAGLDSQYESVVSNVYDHAYQIVKGKVNSAVDMMNCLRKILTGRTAEMQLDMYGPKMTGVQSKEEDK
jgi:hypothetical protein